MKLQCDLSKDEMHSSYHCGSQGYRFESFRGHQNESKEISKASISPGTLQHLKNIGEIPYSKIGGKSF
jgi:hypothetical protein